MPQLESGRDLTGRVGLGQVGSGGVGWGQQVFKYRGSGRVILTRSDPREVIQPAKSPGIFT